MSMRSAAFIKLYERPLAKLFYMTYKEAPPEYSQWINVKDTENAFDDHFKVSEFSTVPRKPEGADTQFEDIIPGDIKRFKTYEYGLGYVITRKMRDDDQTKVMSNLTKALRRSFRHLYETLAAGIFNNATSTSDTYKGMDGGALASATHALLDGTNTYSNYATADFGQTSLENAVINFFRLKGEQNLPIHMDPDTLIGDGGQMFEFKKWTANEFEPDSADRNKNYLRTGAAQNNGVKTYIPSRYWTDTDAWALLAPKANHSMQLYIRINPEYEMGNDFSSGNILGKGYTRVGVGHSDWRGVYFSAGN